MLSFFKSKSDSAPDESLTTSWSANVRRGLTRTRENLSIQLSNILGGGKIDEAIYEELETVLLAADIA